MTFDATTPWPPIPDAVRSPMAGWSAWYEGTPEALATYYAFGYGSAQSRPRVRPSQFAGGIVGALARFWWGQPQTSGQPAKGLHVPLAADIASASADMLFSEELGLDFGKTPEAASKRLLEVLDANSWQALLPEASEVQAALGGVYLRAGWDTSIADHPLLSVVHADHAVPEFRFDRLSAVTLWEVLRQDGQEVWRHLERHEPGRIIHEVRQGSLNTLGRPIPLTEFPETADIKLDGDNFIETGAKGLAVEYVPNVRPSRRWRNEPAGRSLGRADIDGTEPLLDALDETWTSLLRDVRHGKSRIIAASSMLTNQGVGQGATVDLDREVFESVTFSQGENAKLTDLISAQQFSIRVDEHLRTCAGLMGSIVRGAGYSGQSFGLDTDVAKTATEVSSIRDRTRQTREKKTRYWTAALERFLPTIGEIDKHVFGKGGRVEVDVDFPADATTSLETTARSLQMLRAARAISTETAVALAQPGWSEDQVAEEVARILAEESASVVNVVDPFTPDQGTSLRMPEAQAAKLEQP